MRPRLTIYDLILPLYSADWQSLLLLFIIVLSFSRIAPSSITESCVLRNRCDSALWERIDRGDERRKESIDKGKEGGKPPGITTLPTRSIHHAHLCRWLLVIESSIIHVHRLFNEQTNIFENLFYFVYIVVGTVLISFYILQSNSVPHILLLFFQMKSPFTFTIATPSDVQEIFEFLLTDFLFNTSLNGAIGMTREDAYDRYLGEQINWVKWIIDSSVLVSSLMHSLTVKEK